MTRCVEGWGAARRGGGMKIDAYATETPEQFAAFLAAVDRALTEQFGPNHQVVLSGDGGTGCVEGWGGLE